MAEQAPSEGQRPLIEISPEMVARMREPRAVLAIVLALAGIVAEIAGYWGVSGTIDPGEQLPYLISGGIGGVFLLGAAAALFFSLDLHGVKSRLDESLEASSALAEDVRQLRAELAQVADRLATEAPATANGRAAPRRRAPQRAGVKRE